MSEIIGIDALQTSDLNFEGSINSFETSVDFAHAFQIRTQKDGFNAGRKYYVRASSDDVMTSLIADISRISKDTAKKMAKKTEWEKVQKRVRRIYNSTWFQGAAAFLIIAVGKCISIYSHTHMGSFDDKACTCLQNFCTSVIEAQQQADSLIAQDGSPTLLKSVLDNLNIGFTVVFTVELLTNMFAHWFKPFATNSWSVFDALVVLISIVALGPLDFPVSILRALRVVRLFGRLKSSKKILAALSVSLAPMCNAFFIMLIVAMICECCIEEAMLRFFAPAPSPLRSQAGRVYGRV